MWVLIMKEDCYEIKHEYMNYNDFMIILSMNPCFKIIWCTILNFNDDFYEIKHVLHALLEFIMKPISNPFI